MKRIRYLSLISALILLFSLVPTLVNAEENPEYQTATIYYNEACSMCAMYINKELIPTLEEAGIENIIKKDYVNEKQNRIELNELNKEYNIPPTLQGHFMVFIDDKIILGGHVPEHIVIALLTKDFEFRENSKEFSGSQKTSFFEDDKILVLQDEMEDAKSYFAWGFKGDAKEYEINTPINEYLVWFNDNKDSLEEPEGSYESSWGVATILPLIVLTGFLDGINPCAFAVLLFFIVFLYTIHKTKASIWKMGVTYIFAIFLAYFLIGIGLMKAFIFTGAPHLMAMISAYLIISLGILQVYNFTFPKKKINWGIPHFSKEYIKNWMYKATIPATFVVGFLVGLCTFPCSGGMYVAVIGLLATKSTYIQGLTYLVIYNIFFVMPLIITLLFASNKRTTEKLSKWERSESRLIKLISGLVMIALGIIILVWFI